MNRTARAILVAFSLSSIFSGIPLYLRYSHPDMTTTRLSLEYWWVGVILVCIAPILGVLGLIFVGKDD